MTQIHRLFVIFLMIASCNSSENEPPINDSSGTSISQRQTNPSKIDTLKGPIDSTKMLVVTKLDLQNINCDSIGKLLGNGKTKEPADEAFLAMKILECNNQSWNASHSDSPKVTIAVQDISKGKNRILFNTLDAKTVEDMAKIAKNMITLGAAVKSGGSVPITTIATIAGNYSVDSYVEAARKNDPLIIIYPGIIPAKMLTMDTYRTLTKGDNFRPAEYIVNGVVSIIKEVDLPAKAAVDVGKAGINVAKKAAQITIVTPTKAITGLVKKIL